MSKGMKRSNINRNTIYNTLKSVSGIIYPLITFPYISRVLLTDNVGKINFGASIISYVSLVASLGVTTYAVRECSRIKHDRYLLSKTASQIISINLISTFVAYIGLLIVLVFAKSLENYRSLICIQSLSVLFTTLGADWINTAMEDFKYIAIRTVSMQIVSLALMFLFVHKPGDYIIYAGISVLASSGANIINIFYRKKYCATRFTGDMDIKRHLPGILLLFSLIISQTIYVNSDMTILGLIKGDHQVGLYSTSVRIYAMVNTTISSIAWVVMPKLSYYFSQNDYVEINKLLKYALNFILFLGVPCICGIEVIAPQLVTFVAGEAYIDAALSLRILGVALLCSLIGGWVGNMTFLPAGREKYSLRISLVSATMNIVLNLILIPRWGLNAAAFTTAVAECFSMVCSLILIDRNVKIDNLMKMLIGPLIGGAGIIAIGLIMQNLLEKTWQIAIATIFTSVCWYFSVLLVMKNTFFYRIHESSNYEIGGGRTDESSFVSWWFWHKNIRRDSI